MNFALLHLEILTHSVNSPRALYITPLQYLRDKPITVKTHIHRISGKRLLVLQSVQSKIKVTYFQTRVITILLGKNLVRLVAKYRT